MNIKPVMNMLGTMPHYYDGTEETLILHLSPNISSNIAKFIMIFNQARFN